MSEVIHRERIDMPKGKVLVFAGPHGAGKDTLESEFRGRHPKAKRIVRHITRTPNASEQDGRDYHFIDDKTFTRMIDQGEFLEHATYVGVRSGTSKNEIAEKVERADHADLSANFEDGLTLHRKMGAMGLRAVCLFISPCPRTVLEDNPDEYLELLRERLVQRGRPADLIEGRLLRAVKYRELYLDNDRDVFYIDNSNGRISAATDDITKIALADLTRPNLLQ